MVGGCGMVDGGGMMAAAMTGGSATAMLSWLLWFALASFVFSVIFWWVHNWMVNRRR